MRGVQCYHKWIGEGGHKQPHVCFWGRKAAGPWQEHSGHLAELGEEVEASSRAFGRRANFSFFFQQSLRRALCTRSRGVAEATGGRRAAHPGRGAATRARSRAKEPGLVGDGAFGPWRSTPGYPEGPQPLTAAAPPALGW